MKNSKTIRMILAGSLLAGMAMVGGACKKSETEQAREKVAEKREEVADKAEDLKDEKKDVAAEVKDVNNEMKDVNKEAGKLDQAEAELAAAKVELKNAIETRAAKIEAKIAQLEAKGDKKSKELAAEFRIRRDEAKMKLTEASNSAKADWTTFSADVSTRWDKLEKDVDAAL